MQPPSKRLKTSDSTDGEDSHPPSDDESLLHPRDQIPDSGAINGETSQRPTELESALPPVQTDKDAIADYEAMRTAEQEGRDLGTRVKERSWTKGRSSIYVDAFNLALGTVLEDEGHLFDGREMEVFRQWRALEYEAQYL